MNVGQVVKPSSEVKGAVHPALAVIEAVNEDGTVRMIDLWYGAVINTTLEYVEPASAGYIHTWIDARFVAGKGR